jgi:hypothetical protein
MGASASGPVSVRRASARRRRLDRRAVEEEFREGARPRSPLARLAALARDVGALEQARTAAPPRGR